RTTAQPRAASSTNANLGLFGKLLQLRQDYAVACAQARRDLDVARRHAGDLDVDARRVVAALGELEKRDGSLIVAHAGRALEDERFSRTRDLDTRGHREIGP